MKITQPLNSIGQISLMMLMRIGNWFRLNHLHNCYWWCSVKKLFNIYQNFKWLFLFMFYFWCVSIDFHLHYWLVTCSLARDEFNGVSFILFFFFQILVLFQKNLGVWNSNDKHWKTRLLNLESIFILFNGIERWTI